MPKKEATGSMRQQYQRLTQARARAQRNGQPTPKLDGKIEKIRALMGSTVTATNPAKPSPSKYTNYKIVSKLPMQGGKISPR